MDAILTFAIANPVGDHIAGNDLETNPVLKRLEEDSKKAKLNIVDLKRRLLRL